MRKLLLLAGATLAMAACSEASTAPQGPIRQAPGGRAGSDVFCSSGYIVAYDENGNAYCAPDPDARNQNQVQTQLPATRPRRP